MFQFLRRRNSRTVLIVSEDRTDPGLNGAFLRQPNIRLLTCHPDDQGLDLACRERPGLIIEDLALPDPAGLDFCGALRANPRTRSIPLILVAPARLGERARSAGADALLVKPLARRELFSAVRRFIPLPKRRTNRLRLNLRFTYAVGEVQCQAFSRDVSQSGAFLKTDRVLPLGQRLQLCFRVPGSWDEIRCEGIVRNTSYEVGAGGLSGVGVEFERLSDVDTEVLDAFVERRLCRSDTGR